MKTDIAVALGDYVSLVGRIRGDWKLSIRRELWFRAEDASHWNTRLQPGTLRRENGKSVQELLELENFLYEEFERCAPQLSDVRLDPEDKEWDLYFLMQHHGVPTRILDWSDGSLIALHFAIRDKSLPLKTDSFVYVLDADWLTKYLRNLPERKDTQSRWKKYSKKHPYDTHDFEWERLYLPCDEEDVLDPLLQTPRIPMLWDSPHATRRVAAQRSRFMIFGTDPVWLSDLAEKRDSRIAAITISLNHLQSGSVEPFVFVLNRSEQGTTTNLLQCLVGLSAGRYLHRDSNNERSDSFRRSPTFS